MTDDNANMHKEWDAASEDLSRNTLARLDAFYEVMTTLAERKITEELALDNYYRIVLDLGIDDPIPEGMTFDDAAAQATPEAYAMGVRRLLETAAARNPVHFAECMLRMIAPDQTSLFRFAEEFSAARHKRMYGEGGKPTEVIKRYTAIKMAPHSTPQ